MTYLEEIKRSMDMLNENGYLFIGQNMRYGGTSLFHTYKHVPEERRIELPVFEDIQAGLGTGLSLSGYNVISIYPRFDFFILALNQVINHLDKFEEMSDGQFKPKQIFRICVGSIKPLMPGPQHCQNYTEAIKKMVTNIEVRELLNVEDVYKTYEEAVNSDKSFIIVEYSDKYNQDFAMTDIKQSKDIK